MRAVMRYGVLYLIVFLAFVLNTLVFAEPQTGLNTLIQKPKTDPKTDKAKQSDPSDSDAMKLLKLEFESSGSQYLNYVSKANAQQILTEEVGMSPEYFLVAGLGSDLNSNLRVNDDHPDFIVDKERFWKYLLFSGVILHSAESSLANAKSSNICLVLRTEPGCAQCEALSVVLNDEFRKRFPLRGVNVKTGPSVTSENAFDEYLTKISNERIDSDESGTCSGALLTEISSRGTGKENVRRIAVTSHFEFKLVYGKTVRGKAETILAPDTRNAYKSVQALGKMTALHQFAQLMAINRDENQIRAAQGLLAKTNAEDKSSAAQKYFSKEKFIEIHGFDSFIKMQAFKQAFIEMFPQYSVEERVIKQGLQRFAIKLDVPLEIVVQKISKVGLMTERGIKLEVQSVSGEEAVLRVQ